MTSFDVAFPLRDFLDFRIEVVPTVPTTAIARLTLGDRHANPNGYTHGAVLFAMMDTAMGAALMADLGPGWSCATIEINTRFHRGARDGLLRTSAAITTRSKRIAHLAAETLDAQERLVASATASFAIIEDGTDRSNG